MWTLPPAAEGDVLTYTLADDLTDGPVTNGILTDVRPAGLTYVNGSAEGNEEFDSLPTTARPGRCAGRPGQSVGMAQ